ncbi:MAG: peptidylprolyl isomerase [Proteobacteria bacterium]|nr:peptidylprolyl isomerase [Pseudomonadota bacterium]
MNFSIFKTGPRFFISGLLGLFVIQTPVFGYVPLDRIIAVVNEDVIMLSELEAQIRTVRGQIQQQGAQLPPPSILERQVLDRLIQNRIQLQLAAQSGIKVNDELLNRTISNIAAENQVSLSQFREILENDGYSYEKFREDIRNEITLTQLRKRQVENRIIVTEKEIDNFLANQEFQGTFQAEIRLSHILLSLPQAATNEEIEQVKLLANQVREDLLAGGDFAEIAKTVSDGGNAKNGGDLGWRKTDDVPSLFADYIPEMAKGDISEPIQSPSGFHIIKIADVKSDEQNIVEQTLARHILIKADQLTTLEQAHEKILQLKLRLDNGDDFALLAKGNSDDTVSAANGGELGWSTPGQFVPEFERTMEKLGPGEISEPFKTNFGWHIVQVLDRRQYDNTESVKRAKARAAIRNRKLNEAMQNWTRRLRDEAYVEYRLDDI